MKAKSPQVDVYARDHLESASPRADRVSQFTSGSVPEAAPEVQHRQLTVMFADLVGSTNLLEEHGPEAFSDHLRLYHDICTEATRGQDGTVANYLGDGVISYFGYPRGRRTSRCVPCRRHGTFSIICKRCVEIPMRLRCRRESGSPPAG